MRGGNPAPGPLGDDRPVRECVACGQHDNHPRCQVQVTQTDWVGYHPDCHQHAVGDADCHPQCAGGAAPGPGVAMLAAITEHHEKG